MFKLVRAYAFLLCLFVPCYSAAQSADGEENSVSASQPVANGGESSAETSGLEKHKQNTKEDTSEKFSSLRSFSSSTSGQAKQSQQAEVGSGLVTADPVSVVAGLLFVLALIAVVAWLMRRVGQIPSMSAQGMKVVSVLSLGTREKVVLVQVGEQQVLLGVAPGRVSHLQSFEQPVLNPANNSKDFSQTIKQFLQPGSPVEKPSGEKSV